MTVASWRGRISRFNPYFVLLLSLVATLVCAYAVYYFVSRQTRTRLEAASQQVVNGVRSRLERYETSLLQMRSFFVVAERMDAKTFERYVENLTLLERYPGVQGLGFARRVPSDQVQSYERKMRAQGFTDYEVWPKGDRPDFFPIEFLQPHDWRNQRAIGYDMFSEEIRREAMTRARYRGLPALSGAVRLVQEVGQESQPGFLMYVPVFRGEEVPNTPEARMAALDGFLYAPFRAFDIFGAIFNRELDQHRHLHVRIYDGQNLTHENLLYDNDHLFSHKAPDVEAVRRIHQIEIAGRTWTIEVTPRAGFVLDSERYAALMMGTAGLILSLLLYWITLSSRSYAEEEQRARETLEHINSIAKKISGELDLQTLVQSATDAATRVCGAEFGAFFYNVIKDGGEAYTLYTVSGVDRSEFDKFPMPRNTQVFAPTFRGTGIVRSNDITKDPRYGKNPPYNGMPKGHLPVKSYLAVPVISRSGEVLGGMFFGHQEVARFGEQEEAIVQGIASHAAVAIDNARLYKTAQDAIRARDEFLSICSHELKTPITSLKLQAQLANRKIIRNGQVNLHEVEEMSRSMNRQLDQLTRLVDDMLDIARIETGKLELTKAPVELAELTERVVERFRIQAKRAQVETLFHAETPVRVLGDVDRLTQVIMNLLSNALKYGEGRPIEVSVAQRNGSGVLSVRDHGIGIAEKERVRIFERFERLVSHTNISGMGLGLFISKQIVDAHGGRIRVDEAPGGGTLFEVEIPRGEGA